MDRSPNPLEIPISMNKEFQVFWKTLRIYCWEMINILEVILNQIKETTALNCSISK